MTHTEAYELALYFLDVEYDRLKDIRATTSESSPDWPDITVHMDECRSAREILSRYLNAVTQ